MPRSLQPYTGPGTPRRRNPWFRFVHPEPPVESPDRIPDRAPARISGRTPGRSRAGRTSWSLRPLV